MKPFRSPLAVLAACAVAAGILGAACAPPPNAVGKNGNPTVAGGASNDPNIVLRFAPNAASAAAPEIAKPGTRFTYHVISATVKGEGDKWVPNENGIWENPATGERYDRKTKEAGGSSDTYEQYDLVGLDDEHSLTLQSTLMITPNLTDPVHSGTVIYHLGAPGFGSSIWASPESLQQLPTMVEPNRRIRKGEWPMGNGTTEAVTLFEWYPTNKCFYAFDLKTGLMIEYSIAGRSDSGLKAPDELGNTGNTMMVSGQIVNARTLNIPWANDPEPDWTANLKAITYTSTSTFSMSGQTLQPITSKVRFEVKDRAKSWIQFEKKVIASDGPDVTASQPMPFINSRARLDPLWIHPSSLAKLQPGQVLDTDNLTHVVVKVGDQQQGPKGPYLEIIHGNASEESRFGYDLKTGLMVSLQIMNQSTYTRTNMTIDSTE